MSIPLTLGRVRTGSRSTLRRGSPLARGLLAAWSWPEGKGTDVIAGVQLTAKGGASQLDPYQGLVTDVGSGTSSSWEATCPKHLQLTVNFTIVWAGIVRRAIDTNAGIFGCSFASTNTSPFVAYSIASDGTTPTALLGIDQNWGGSFSQAMSSDTRNVGPMWCAATFASGAQNFYQCTYNNVSNPISVRATNNKTGVITYGSGPVLAFGQQSFVATANSGISHYYGLIYNRVLTTAELTWLYTMGRTLFYEVGEWDPIIAGVFAANSAKPSYRGHLDGMTPNSDMAI